MTRDPGDSSKAQRDRLEERMRGYGCTVGQIAAEMGTTQSRPRTQSFAGARFDLAIAYLGGGELDAVGEHLTPILHATDSQYRTVPIIGRARSLYALLAQRTDLASPALTTLRDDLAGFITHPAPTPPQLESGPTT